MKFIFGVVIIVILTLAYPISGKRIYTNEEIKQLIHKRQLHGIHIATHRNGLSDTEIDCKLHLYTGRFWILDEILQVFNNVTSFISCVKKCYQYSNPRCKAVNYIQDMQYCELEDMGFMDDPMQIKGTLGEIKEMGEPAHADLYDCRDLPSGQEPITTTSTTTTTTKTATTTTTTTATPEIPIGDPIPEAATCGTPKYQPSIDQSFYDASVTGTEPIPNSWPWTVNIFYNNKHRCTGSLIRVNDLQHRSDIIITAASCFIGKNDQDLLSASKFRVVLGGHRVASPTGPGQITGIAEYHFLSGFDRSFFSDLAIVKLDRVINFGPTILPVCLPRFGESFKVDALCFSVGWAESNLNQLRITPYTPNYCEKVDICGAKFDRTRCFCGGKVNGLGPGTNLDAGSPLTCKINNRWQQMGLVATINEMPCLTANISSANVFIRIPNVRSWIDDEIRQLTTVR